MRRCAVPMICLLATGLLASPGTAGAQIPPPEIPGSISGRVMDEAGGPLEGICVTAFDLAYQWAGDTITAADGTYRISDLAPGQYKVLFNQCVVEIAKPVPASSSSPPLPPPPSPSPENRYLSEWWNDKPDFDSANAVTVAQGADTAGIDAALALGGSFRGRVTDSSNAGVDSICVAAYDDSFSWAGFGSTGPDGAYSVTRLPAGSYRVEFNDCAYPQRFLSEWWKDKPDFSSADPVAVTQGADTPGIDAVLAPIPVVDLAVTKLSVENVPVQTDYGNAGYTGWTRRVHVEVSNLGEAAPPWASLAVIVRTTTDYRPRCIGSTDVSVPVGGRAVYSFEWNGLGQVGDVEVEAVVSAQYDRKPANDRMEVRHYVVAGGTGFGLTALPPPFPFVEPCYYPCGCVGWR